MSELKIDKNLKGYDEIIVPVLNEFKNILLSHNITELLIVGSIARNEAFENSDVDICIINSAQHYDYLALKSNLEILFNRKVDIIKLDNVAPHISDSMINDGIEMNLK